jgi:hypothetical protein
LADRRRRLPGEMGERIAINVDRSRAERIRYFITIC